MLFNAGKPMKPLTIYWSPDFLEHRVSQWHPESADRLAAVVDELKRTGQWEEYEVTEARAAAREEIAAIHPMEYIKRVDETIQGGARMIDSSDTEVSPGSFLAARKVVGAGLQAVDDVLGGDTRTAFILGRPPGHHARPTTAMGFCLFSNASLAAQHALDKWQLNRIAIVDWDVHHGNGTQEIFFNSNRVFFTSLHEFPFYPGTGAQDEKGLDAGAGYTLNFPLPAGKGDQDYLDIIAGPVADALTEYQPELILISAGFDAHKNDPLGHMLISSAGFGQLTELVTEIARETSEGRIVSFLEGGYDLKGLAESVSLHLRMLAE
jgi:acetoin utilization deacetylase AcuC-like enzyme